jgi:hypothetical protein
MMGSAVKRDPDNWSVSNHHPAFSISHYLSLSIEFPSNLDRTADMIVSDHIE